MLYKSKRDLIDALAISPEMKVLDVGFSGQAVKNTDPEWPHALLKEKTENLYGLDLELDSTRYLAPNYISASAEDFSFPIKFDLIFAGDLIEHLSNPGKFLTCAKQHLAPGGRLVMTTPNAFNLFNIIEKITHDEPNVNPDHTLYFNKRVMGVLLEKQGIQNYSFNYLYTLGTLWQGGVKRKIVGSLYWILSKFTPKFTEDFVITVQN